MTTLAFSRLIRDGWRSPARFLTGFLHRADLQRSRRALQRLDDHLLRDVGLTRQEAEAEAARPDWQAPPHWRC